MSYNDEIPDEDRRMFIGSLGAAGLSGFGFTVTPAETQAMGATGPARSGPGAPPADRAALQSRLDLAHSLSLPVGAYALGGGVLSMGDGDAVTGDSNQYSIVSSTGADASIVRVKAAGASVRVGPTLTRFEVRGRQGIRIGEPAAFVRDDNLNDAFFPWRLQDMRLTDTGDHAPGSYGFQGSKLFNGQITSSVITGFGTSVLLHACDNNLVFNNRFWGFKEFAVYEAAAQTFGSHNWLCFNDIASPTGDQAIYDKSFAQHPRRFGNYYELAPCKGGLDFSLIDARIFGRNAPTTALTTIILRDNRIDSQGNGSFVYRVDPTRATTLRIEGVQTSDMSATPSLFVDADGDALDFVPLHLSSGRARRVYLEETTFGPHWDGHRSKQGVSPNGRGFRITAENAASIAFGSALTGADGVAHFRGQQIIIPGGHANRSIGVFPDGYLSGNRYFADGALYRVTLLARSSRATGDSISVQQAMLDARGAPMGTAFMTKPLTSQFRALDFRFPGRPADYQTVGFNVRSETSVGNIEFTLCWEEMPDG